MEITYLQTSRGIFRSDLCHGQENRNIHHELRIQDENSAWKNGRSCLLSVTWPTLAAEA